MSKILLVGPAGCGKTHQLLDSFVEALSNAADPLAEDLFFVVPSAEHTERVISLLIQRGLKGFFHKRVTTLSRLAADLFRVSDIPVASSLTRMMIVRDLVRENQWDYFEGVREQPGFIGLMAQFITELKEACLTPEIFRERMNELKGFEPAYRAKYEALADFYGQYEVQLKERGLRDGQDALRIFRERKKEKGVPGPRFKALWIDGFFDFSNLQQEYLRELSGITGDITIALTKETGQQQEEVFESVNRTQRDLETAGFQTKLMKPQSWRTKNPALLFLQKNLFVETVKGACAPQGITLLNAIGTEGEIEMIARQIHQLYKVGDHRYGDFAVLFRQIRHYAPVITAVFARYGIPVEVHERDRLKFSPWIAATTALLSVFRNEWKPEDLFAFLRSGFVRQLGKELPRDDAWIAVLEQRSFREGVTGTREAWLADWKKGSAKDLEEFNEKKKAMLQELEALEGNFRSARTAEEYIRIFKRAVYDSFGILEVSDHYTPLNRRDAACVRRFEALLEEIRGYSLKHQVREMSFESFADHFLGLVELDVYSLHERDKNRVQVYDISLARQKEYKVVFVAGLLEKVFPMQVREDPLLSDWERRLMNGERECPLAERLPRQNIERFFFYLAVTRAKERLYLSCPHLDFEGKESLPSFYLEAVKHLFQNKIPVIRQDLARPFPEIREAITRRELEISAAADLRKAGGEDPAMREILSKLSGDLGSRDRFLDALKTVEAGILDEKILREGYFEIEKTSPTRLETYAKCPYRYFADRILRLKEAGQDLSAMQKGSILHFVLQQYFDPRRKQNKKETLEQFIEREIGEGLKLYPMTWAEAYQEALDRRELFEMLLDFLKYETERLESSSFKPRYVEYSFGSPNTNSIEAERRLGPSKLPFGKEMKSLEGAGKGEAPPLEIEGEKKNIKLRGRVDRIDTDPEKKFAVVMDYKRSYSFKSSDLELGTALQLPLYLLAAQKHLGLTPLGAAIYSIRDHKRSGFYCAELAKLFEKEFSSRSCAPGDIFQKTLDRAVIFFRKFMKEINNAKISVRPRDCESFCPYGTVCRIEKWKLPVILEEIKKEDRADPELGPTLSAQGKEEI